MSIQALREQRANAAKQLRTLVDNSKDKQWTEDNQKEYDSIVANIESIDQNIDRQQKVLDIDAANNEKINRRAEGENISTDEAATKNEKEKAIFNSWLSGGVNALTQEQQQYVAQRAREVRNTMSTGTGSEGGFLVPNEFSAQLLQSLKEFGGMRSVAQVIQTSSGATMDFPTTDATTEEGEVVGENASVSNEDATFGTKPLSVQKFSSKTIAVPFELLTDSTIDLSSHINERLTQRLGRITNRLFTVGTGVGQPTGIITAASAGKIGASGSTDSVGHDDLIDLIHSVDPAYRSGNCGFMFHDTTLRELKKLKDSQGRPLWLAGLSSSDPDTINNYAYTINQHMATMAANAKSIAFGDLSRYVIRDVSQVMLFRMTDSKYTEKGQVGFLAFMRSVGNLMDVGGAVKYYQNSAS